MKLGHKSTSNNNHLTQSLGIDQHYTPQQQNSTISNNTSNTDKNDRKAELEKRREERRQVNIIYIYIVNK